MLSNNNERLNIIQKMTDPCNYLEFKKLCEEAGIRPLDVGTYAQKLGILLVSKYLFPTYSDAEAYLALVSEMNKNYNDKQPELRIDPVNLPTTGSRKCGGCGGGTVR